MKQKKKKILPEDFRKTFLDLDKTSYVQHFNIKPFFNFQANDFLLSFKITFF